MLAKFKVYIIMLSAFAIFAGVAYWYYKDTQVALRTYAENQSTLETSLALQKQATESIARDMRNMKDALSKLNLAFEASRETVDNLEKKFEQSTGGKQRDIGKDASRKPGLVEPIINNAVRDTLRCGELLSGATPTDEEAKDEKFSDCIMSN